MEWRAWSLKIGNKAFKNVRPLYMDIKPEIIKVTTKKRWFWNQTEKRYTGRWVIGFKYDRGPCTANGHANIVFKKESEAQWWFDHIWTEVFIKKDGPVPPPPPKKKPVTRIKPSPKKKGNHLRLV